jgi:cholinesterase
MKLLAVAALLSTSVMALETLVDVSYTKYQGTALPNGISQWLGIRYAAPPVGALRFEPPQDPLQNNTIQLADQVCAGPGKTKDK